MDDENPPYNPNYIDERDFQRSKRNIEDYDIDRSESPSGQQANTLGKGTSTKSARQIGGAAVAGTVAGLAVSGPIVGAAAGGAAAYAATRNSGTAGNAARQTGEAVATAGDKAKEVNERHEITKRSMMMAKSALQKAKELDEKHQIVQNTKKMAASAVTAAKNVDEKHHVTAKTKKAAGTAVAKAKGVDEKHHVTEKTRGVALATTKKVALGVKFISKSMASKKAPKNADTVPVDII
mmetsp:Transcript_5861/g.9483  ORF Transcript_5861/g.9483 Transcript_5861/m.9483 type:complete len:237 (+) Transcript_5861:118-828(+)|eukprot:CAMPEP_0183732514 /NCGR_PEP_ID=MMETSP0737-20130205/38648_1 /TAXON_ID=385413 /ORGANISM="Thalassiosira miniscula, Strain CCMP1093" /LENGTH=236 /DNA_ID=CAMNT_0025965543 /DNA_START=193 /DNA_END=903 /DNA_ORIENTATION=-